MIKCIKCFGQVATNMTNDINIRRLLCNNQPNAALFTFCVSLGVQFFLSFTM